MTAVKPTQRYASLSILRAIVACVIMMQHVMTTFSNFKYRPDLVGMSAFGRALMLPNEFLSVFFLLSGLSLVMTARGRVFDTRRFAISRFFRVFPQLWITLGLYFAFRVIYSAYLQAGIAEPTWFISLNFIRPITLTTWLTHLTLTFELFNEPVNFNLVLWMLPILVQFYILFPALWWILNRPRWGALGLGIAAVAAVVFNQRVGVLAGGILSVVWLFAIGMLIAHFEEPIVRVVKRREVRAVLMLVIPAVILMREFERFPPIVIYPLLFVALILLALSVRDWQPDTQLARFVDNLGNWSFSIYLLHVLVLAFFAPPILALGMPLGIYAIVVTVVVFTVSIRLGALSYRYIEIPFRVLGKRIIARVLPPSPAPVVERERADLATT